VAAAFRGIQACVVFLILSAGIKLLKKLPKTFFSLTVFGVTLVGMLLVSLFAVNFSTVFFILIGAFLGISVYLVGLLRGKKGSEVEK
jgi:chromate transporter